MGEEIQSDSLVLLTEKLASRLRWEMENGCHGYPTLEVSCTSDTPPSGSTQMERGPAPDSAPDSAPDKRLELEALRNEIGDCQRCDLGFQRKTIVFGEGNVDADLVFVGEGPGRDEDAAGRPFVGAAGQLLDKIMAAMGIGRDHVYICNVVKCRPPKNRVPFPGEQRICGRFLHSQLSVIEPKIVVALGGTATQFLLESEESIGRLRGRFHERGRWKVMPTYHPAYLLRNPGQKRAVWEDIQLVMSQLGLEFKREHKKG